MITPEEADNLSLQEAFQFIFEPGFSTAEKVTDISGRGVGMDVVKTKIESLGGTVDIVSQRFRHQVYNPSAPFAIYYSGAAYKHRRRNLYRSDQRN